MFFGVLSFFFIEISEFFMVVDLFNYIFKLKENDALMLFNHDGYIKRKESSKYGFKSKVKLERISEIHFSWF